MVQASSSEHKMIEELEVTLKFFNRLANVPLKTLLILENEKKIKNTLLKII